MANEGNLKPQNQRTKSEQRETARKGGIASGKARRERKQMREVLEQLLADTYTDKNGKQLDGTTMLMLAAMSKAQKGDMRALEFIRATVGEDPVKHVQVDGTLKEEQARFGELLDQLKEDS